MGYCGSGCGGNYTLDTSQGSAGCDYDAPVSGPQYARFYSASAHENFTDVKYDKVSANYDKETQAIIDSVQGPPLQAYIPMSRNVPDSGSAAAPVPRDLVVMEPRQDVIVPKNIVDEIQKAQREILGSDFNTLQFREVEIEEEIRIRRRIKKRQIILRK